jgi:LmbE family N-acetylglucosaminyl deacetylase
MHSLALDLNPGAHLLAIAAHPDDIEIGCGGLLLRLAEECPDLSADFAIATGEPVRETEALQAAESFLPGCKVSVHSARLPDGRLPGSWSQAKEFLETVAATGQAPDLILAPRRTDAHQDHRTLAELVPTVWRDHLVLGYEIPKWDGDLDRPWLYVPLSEAQLLEKVSRLHEAFPSQVGREWFDPEVFRGLARLRGMECRARYAEAFTTSKAVLKW